MEERSSRWRKILEIRELCGNKCQGPPGTQPVTAETGHQQLGSCTAQTDTTFCPTFPDQQPPPCWGGKQRLVEYRAEGVQVIAWDNQIKSCRFLNNPQYPDPLWVVFHSVSPMAETKSNNWYRQPATLPAKWKVSILSSVTLFFTSWYPSGYVAMQQCSKTQYSILHMTAQVTLPCVQGSVQGNSPLSVAALHSTMRIFPFM